MSSTQISRSALQNRTQSALQTRTQSGKAGQAPRAILVEQNDLYVSVHANPRMYLRNLHCLSTADIVEQCFYYYRYQKEMCKVYF